MSIELFTKVEKLPLKSVFRISRGAKTSADVILVVLSFDNHIGWAEAVPYGRYGESITSVTEQIEELAIGSKNLTSIDSLAMAIAKLPPGAARNALDCALWDLKAKLAKASVIDLMLLPELTPSISAQTLSIDTPAAMAKSVQDLNNPPLVKIKLDNENIIEKMTAIYQAAPISQFIIDANEAWSFTDLIRCVDELKAMNVVLIEQPLPANQDQQLENFDSPIPLCADESCHTRTGLENLVNKYQAINIKLDKTGGLTEAFQLAQAAQDKGFEIMLGCMVGSSLAMAPASILRSFAKYVDLDGPTLVSTDRKYGFVFDKGIMPVLDDKLWGGSSNKYYHQVQAIITE